MSSSKFKDEQFVEVAINRIVNLINYSNSSKEDMLDSIVSNFSVSREEAYLLYKSAVLLNQYRKSGSDIDII